MSNNFDIEEIREYIKNSAKTSAVYVGCDSHKTTRRGKREVVFITVVIIHLQQAHGGKIFHRKDITPEFPSNKARLLKEVEMAVDVGFQILDSVGDRPLKIHLDLNPSPNHFSNCVVNEAIGWVRGMGMTPVIKPDSWAASAAADFIAVRAAN